VNFLAAHEGLFFCNACLSEEAGVESPVEANKITKPLRGVKPYRHGKLMCSKCREDRHCTSFK
jgi:hypothetical protein